MNFYPLLHTLTKEYLYEQHITNKKTLSRIGKESGYDHKTIARYLHYHNIEHIKNQYDLMKKKNHKNWRGFGDIPKHYWINIKNGANSRNIPFILKIEEAWDLFLRQNKKCALSNIDLEFGNYQEKTSASLDRIDSNGIYELKNVQWLHRDVNFAKQNLSDQYFVLLCKKIVDHSFNKFST